MWYKVLNRHTSKLHYIYTAVNILFHVQHVLHNKPSPNSFVALFTRVHGTLDKSQSICPEIHPLTMEDTDEILTQVKGFTLKMSGFAFTTIQNGISSKSYLCHMHRKITPG